MSKKDGLGTGDWFSDFMKNEDLFGKDGLFGEDGLGADFFDKPSQDPRAKALIESFRKGVEEKDRAYLETAVLRYHDDVLQYTGNTDLLEAYALAAVYVNQFSFGYESLCNLKSPSIKQRQASGVIAYGLERFEAVVHHLQSDTESLCSPARMAYAMAMIRTGKQDMPYYQQVLSPILEKLAVANALLGNLSLEAKDLQSAELYFSKAAVLSPESEKVRLDYMRVMCLNGREQEVYAQMNEFYVATGSQLSHGALEHQLKSREIGFPKMQINNLFGVVQSILK